MNVLEKCPASGYGLHVIGVSDMTEAGKRKHVSDMQTPYSSSYHLYTFSNGGDDLVEWMISNIRQNVYCGGRPDMREGWAFNFAGVSQVEALREHFEGGLRKASLPTSRNKFRDILAGAVPIMLAFLALRDDRDGYVHYVQVRVFDRG